MKTLEATNHNIKIINIHLLVSLQSGKKVTWLQSNTNSIKAFKYSYLETYKMRYYYKKLLYIYI